MISYLWDLVKLMEDAKTGNSQAGQMQMGAENQNTGDVEKQIRSRVRVEMRRYFLRQKRRSVNMVAGILLTLGMYVRSVYLRGGSGQGEWQFDVSLSES